VGFLIEDSQDEKRKKVQEGTETTRIHQIDLNPKVTEGRRKWKKAEINLKRVEESREEREKVAEGR
jgi:hypothetical protein